MAFHNVNYSILALSGAQNLAAQGYNGATATTVHEVFCTANGSIEITAIGGGTATFPLTVGQSVKILVGSYDISSGSFVGFRSKGDKPGFNPNTALL